MLILVLACLLSLSSLPHYVCADFPPFNNSAEYMAGRWGNYTRQHFLSQPDVVAPVANILVQPTDQVSPSKYIMFAPAGRYGPPTHPMMLDTHTLSPVWYGPQINPETLHASIQSCNGTEYIAFWSGFGAGNWKQGSYYLLDETYQIVYNVTGQGRIPNADAHELYLTQECTAIFTAFVSHQTDLTWQNITNVTGGGWLLDSYFQEIDIATNRVVFEWQASKHIDVRDSPWLASYYHEGYTHERGFDWFHINSIQKDHLGNFLVNSRHMHAMYYISGTTGDVIWSLGGKNNDFKDMSEGLATDFEWQHHARWVDDRLDRISVFDNHATALHLESGRPSRGMVIRLDYEKREAWLEHEYNTSHHTTAFREGSMQVLNDSPQPGNALVGYGYDPAWTEYTANGTVIWEVTASPLGLNRWTPDNYRVLKSNWTGKPLYMPSIAPGPKPHYHFVSKRSSFDIMLKDASGNTLVNDTAYFSWNGATEVRSWVILASNKTSELTLHEHFWAHVPKVGFEENVFVGNASFVTALAIDADEVVLGQTAILDMRDYSTMDGLVRGEDGRYNTTNLTTTWQSYMAKQRRPSLFDRIRLGWQRAKSTHLEDASTNSHGQTGLLLASLVVLLVLSVYLYYKRKGRGYVLIASNDLEFAGEYMRKKDDGNF
ncbi:ASST-domain-containing protein [Elsinoe ampelina]|uniref:ASST-domain-containing protein n=1 Tax=Elsinoe ampelina TaxID=302913 RepID=A0A6A6GL24_9PEZI|nr:ASST-domain-containing protein [Elsinoe ampelina]